MPTPPRLLLFDPYTGGHHAEFVRWVAEAWRLRAVPGRLVVGVAPALLAAHPTLRDLAYDAGGSAVAVEALEGAEALVTAGSLAERGRINGRLLRQAVEAHRPERALLMYLDHVQLALATGLRFRSPVGLSGILFRPELHYGTLGHPPTTVRSRLRALRKDLVLRAALRNPHLTHVFSLDPTAVPALQRLAPRARAVFLPDPAPAGTASIPPGTVRRAWGIEPDRTLALLFGSLEERKGVLVLLEALLHVPEGVARRLAVAIAGRSYPDVRPRLEALAARVHAETAVQLVLREAHVPDDAVQDLVGAADLVLAPYQRHVGSSGVLMRAAVAGIPVLAQDYGLVGHQVRTFGLGRVTDTTDPAALAKALTAAVERPHEGFSPARARAFAAPHTVEAFVDVLFASLLTEGPGAPHEREHAPRPPSPPLTNARPLARS